MKLVKCLLLLATMATVVSGSAMMKSFKRYRDKKANQHRLPSSAKGVICQQSGRKPKDTCCYHKHGVRCSPDFQSEYDTCPGAGCPRRIVEGCSDDYEFTYDSDSEIREKIPLREGARCEYVEDDDGWQQYTVVGPCKTNGDIQESVCPQPCGCVLDGKPKRESSGTMKTHKIKGECGSSAVLRKMRRTLKSWKVPRATLNNYEMAALFDKAEFAVFDLFIQPKQNEARYKLAIGAARCHRKHVEIGYMDTGMWTVDTLNNYKCHWRGGCSKVGIPPESIESARTVLEHYAWTNLHVGRRRLSEDDGDSMDDLFVHIVDIPESTEESRSKKAN